MSPLSSIPMNGVDRFMLALDSLAQRCGGNNTCHIAITLEQPITADDLRTSLEKVIGLTAIRRLRCRGFIKRAWCSTCETPIEVREFDSIDALLAGDGINPHKDSPIRFSSLSSDSRVVVFSWHHSLTDAHGAATFLSELALGEISSPIGNEPPRSWRSSLSDARSFARHLFKLNPTPPARLHNKGDRGTGKGSFDRIVITESDFTRACRACSAELFPSLVCLAATCIASWSVSTARGSTPGPLYIPVPHDLRRRVRTGTWFGNQVTFLFFRVEYRADHTLRDVTHELLDQMHASFEDDMPKRTANFFNSWIALPNWLYTRLLVQPASGVLASLFFSDLGKRSSVPRNIAGVPVIDFTHFPPNIAPPGLTVVVESTHLGREILLVTDRGLFDQTDRRVFLQTLSNVLTPQQGAYERDAV